MAQSQTDSESLPGDGGVDRCIQEAICLSSINRKDDRHCLVGAPAPLQEVRSFDAGREAAGQEEEPSVHLRGTEARAALLAIGQKSEVAMTIALSLF